MQQREPLRAGRMIKKLFFFFFVLTGSCSFAQGNDLVINADHISYQQDQIVAEGSAEAVYKDVKILGDRLIYNTKERAVLLDRGFIFFYGDVVLRGQELEYLLDADRGAGKKVFINYESVNLEGNKLEFNRQEIKLANASFDTCGIKPAPHYHISARQIFLYPKSNWLVAYWGIFWYGRIPTLPIPVYVYDMEAERKGKHNILPYPEIGSNDEDGFFVNEKVLWYASRELNGSFSINYAGKKGMGGGVESNYILNKDSQGNARIYGNYYEPFWGGITHHFYFGPSFTEKFLPTDIFAAATFRQFDLETTLSLRERINYERVTKFPEVVLKFKNPNLKIGGAVISENSSEAIAKANASLLLEHEMFKKGGFRIIPSLLLDYSRYSGGQYWWRNMGKVVFERKWGDLFSATAGYSHFFDNQGGSPFAHENYKLAASDQFLSNFQLNIDKSTFMVDMVHDLPGWTPYDIDYTIEGGVHCHAVGLRYRAIRKEFNLVFRIF